MARNQTLQTITPLFGETWFEKHQRGLLWLLNFPMIRSWFRWCLKIHRCDCRTRITQIGPNRFSWGDELFRENGRWHLRRTTDFRTHPKFAKRLYYAFRPLWWTLHAWDWFIADRIVPALSWGFDSLTAYPQAGSGGANVTWDGWIGRLGYDEIFTTMNTAAGTHVGTTDATVYLYVQASSTTNQFTQNRKLIETFDTSSLGSTATISAATLSLNTGGTTTTDLGTTPIHIAGATPASNNTLVIGDYLQCGSTSFSSIAWASIVVGYNDFALNAAGIANINKTEVSRFSTQLEWQINNSFTGTWASGLGTYYTFYMADQTDTIQDPKLVVTYTVSGEEFIPQIQII